MTQNQSQKTVSNGHIRLLMVVLAGGNFGIDADQVAQIIPTREANLRHVFSFLASVDRTETVVRTSARTTGVALIPKGNEDGTKKSLLVDHIEDILSVPVSAIRPFPSLMALEKNAAAYWGMVMIEDKPIILLDLAYWLRQRTMENDAG